MNSYTTLDLGWRLKEYTRVLSDLVGWVDHVEPLSDGWAQAYREQVADGKLTVARCLDDSGVVIPTAIASDKIRITRVMGESAGEALKLIAMLPEHSRMDTHGRDLIVANLRKHGDELRRIGGDLLEAEDRLRATAKEARRVALEQANEQADSVTTAPASAEPLPNHETEQDGPFDKRKFRFKGKVADFGRAGKRYSLVCALWDSKNRRPRRPRDTQEIIDEIWGDDQTSDEAFRRMVCDARSNFADTGLPLTIETIGATVRLKDTSL